MQLNDLLNILFHSQIWQIMTNYDKQKKHIYVGW